MVNELRILFIGCVVSSEILLNELIENDFEICGVITKEKSILNSDHVNLSGICLKNGIDYMYYENVSKKNLIDFICDKAPDIIYCFGWSHLLDAEVIQIPKLGVVGFHPTKLPMNRGRHPIIWALVLGLEKTASTFFMIDEGADTGDIISQADVMIDLKDNAYTLYSKIMKVARKQVIHITKAFMNDEIVKVPQDSFYVNYWRKRTKDDGKIDFRMSSISIYNLVRALSRPYSGAHFIKDNIDYTVWEVEIVNDEFSGYMNIESGKIMEVESKSKFVVKSGDGAVRITKCDEVFLRVGDYL